MNSDEIAVWLMGLAIVVLVMIDCYAVTSLHDLQDAHRRTEERAAFCFNESARLASENRSNQYRLEGIEGAIKELRDEQRRNQRHVAGHTQDCN